MSMFSMQIPDKLFTKIKHEAIDKGETIKQAVMSGRYSEKRARIKPITPVIEPIAPIDKPAPAKKTVIGPITKDKKRIPLTF